MTCEKVFEFYNMLHLRITQHGGTDWFVDRAGIVYSMAEVMEKIKEKLEKIFDFDYFIRPAFSSSAGPVNPNHYKSAKD